MGQFVNLKPNAVVGGGGPVEVYPSGTVHGVLADTNDLTYVAFNAPGDWIKVAFEDYVLSSSRRVWGVWIQSREVGIPPSTFQSNWGPEDVGFGTYFPGLFELYTGNSFQFFQSPVQYRDWNGVDWGSVSLNRLNAYVYMTARHGSGIALLQLYVGMYVIDEPTAYIYRPGNMSRGISKTPTITWAYNGNGEPQYTYHVKIFEPAVAEDAFFNPENWPTLYDSEERQSSTDRLTIPSSVGLESGETYYVAVKVSKNLNFNGATGHETYYSPWSTVVKFTVNLPPTVTVLGPLGDPEELTTETGETITTEDGEPLVTESSGGTITTTNRPMITWLIEDETGTGDFTGEKILATEVKLFHSMFPMPTPDDDPDYTSGVVAGGNQEWYPTTSLANGLYIVYVRAQGGDGEWGPWSEPFNFSLTVVVPDPPAVTLTADGDNARWIITLDPPATGLIPTHFILEKSEPDTGWQLMRGFADPEPIGTQALQTFYDWEPTPGQTSGYRIRTVYVTGDQVRESQAVGWVDDLFMRYVWLRDPLDPTNGVRFPVEDVWLVRTPGLKKAVHFPVGRKFPVIVSGVGSPETFGVTYTIIGREKYTLLMALLESGNTLMVLTPKEKTYVQVVGLTMTEHLWDELHGEEDLWRVTATYQEVESP